MNKTSRSATMFAIGASYVFGQIPPLQDLTPEPEKLKFVLKTTSDPRLAFFIVNDEAGKVVGTAGVDCIKGEKFARIEIVNTDGTSTKITAFPLQKPTRGSHGGFLRTEAEIVRTVPQASDDLPLITDHRTAEKEVRQDIRMLQDLYPNSDITPNESSLISSSCPGGKANGNNLKNEFKFQRDRLPDKQAAPPASQDDDTGFRPRPIPLFPISPGEPLSFIQKIRMRLSSKTVAPTSTLI